MEMITGFSLNQKASKEEYSNFFTNNLNDLFKNITFAAKDSKGQTLTLNGNDLKNKDALDKFIKLSGLNPAEVKAFLADLQKNKDISKEQIVIDLSDVDYHLKTNDGSLYNNETAPSSRIVDKVELKNLKNTKLEKVNVNFDIADKKTEPKQVNYDVSVETTTQDTTLKGEISDKFDFALRYYQNSPLMLDKGVVGKVTYHPFKNTDIILAAGHFPEVFSMSIGPNQLEKHPTSVVSLGINDKSNIFKLNLPGQLKFSGDINSFAVATLGYDHADGQIDKGTIEGLSRANVGPSLTLSRDFLDNKLHTAISYKTDFDLGMIGAYYVTGGKSIPPVTQFVQGTVSADVKGVNLGVTGYVPIKTYSNEFSTDPLIKLSVGYKDKPYIPDTFVTFSPDGVKNAGLGKSVKVNPWLDVSAYAGVETSKFSNKPEFMAGGGLTVYLGKRDSSQQAKPLSNHLMNDWKSDVPLTQKPNTTSYDRSNPTLSDYFSSSEIDKMKNMSIDELKKVLNTPEKVTAYLAYFVKYDYDRVKNNTPPYGSLSPEEVVNSKKGVCRDQHILVTDLLKAQGIEAVQVGYSAAGSTLHAIAVYKDPTTGKWNVIEYGNIHYTQANTMEEAFNMVRPDAWVYGKFEDGGSKDRRAQKGVYYSPSASEYYNFVLNK